MKILVTGATGFLGQGLVPHLKAQGHQVTPLGSKDADLRRSGALDSYKEPYDQIYHLASWTQAGDFCLKHPGEQWVINQQINATVLAWWQARQPQAKLIAIGTSCAYEEGSGLKEEEYLLGTPIESLFTYAMTKRMMHVGLLALQKQYGLRWFSAVPSTLYGPDYHVGRQMHFIFDLMRKIIRGKELGEPVVLWGHGNQRREAVFREDFVKLLVQLAGRLDNELVNLGAGEDYSIKEFAAAICKAVGYPVEKIQYDATKYVGAESKFLNTDKLKKLVPGLKYLPLSEGIARTVKWFYDSGAYKA